MTGARRCLAANTSTGRNVSVLKSRRDLASQRGRIAANSSGLLRSYETNPKDLAHR